MIALGALAAGLAAACVPLALAGERLGLRLGPPLELWRRRAERLAAEATILPALEALAGAARAGLVLRDALALARERARGELRSRLDDALAREELGDALATAVGVARSGATRRVDEFLADVQLCASAHLGAERVAALFEDVVGARRFERELASDLHARTAGLRFQVWLLAGIVPGLALYLSAMSPTLADELASPLGRAILIPAGAAFELAGLIMTRRILSRAAR